MKRNDKRALPVILLAIFLDLVANGILVPIVPQLLANPNSPYYLLPANIPISYAYLLLGLLISAFPIFMFFSTPVMGEYSDYVGRRKVMTLALVGSAISLGLFAWGVMAKSLTLLFIGRILGGIMGGNLSVAQAAMADITPPEKRTARFGLIGAAYGFGFIVGPVLGGLLSSPSIVSWFNASTPFWFAAILSAVNALLVFMYLPSEVKPPYGGQTSDTNSSHTVNWHRAVQNITHAYGMKRVRMVFATNFLFQAGLALFATFFAVFLTSAFGFNQVAVGYYIAYAGVWVIISQGLVLRWLSKRYEEVALLRVFLFLGAGSVFLYYITEHTIGLLVVGACFALTNGIAMAALPSLASRRTSDEHQGEIMGINTSVQALAQAIPPILAGFLASQITPSAPVYIAGAVIGAGWLLFIFTVKKEQ